MFEFIERFKCEELVQSLKDKEFIYIPNPGNGGDSIIVVGTFLFFENYNCKLRIGDYRKTYTNELLVYAGGGNLVGEYDACENFLKNNHKNNDIIILPHTIKDNLELLKSLNDNVTIFCREKKSYKYLTTSNLKCKTYLTHDMAFYINIKLPIDVKPTRDVFNCIRTDSEKTNLYVPPDNFDISNKYAYVQNNTSCPNTAALVTIEMIKHLINYKSVKTNRLHVCILSCLLNIPVNIFDNSYHKNRSIFEHSIRGVFDMCDIKE